MAGNCLYKSVASLMKQTYANIEIILVNDCSPDNSLYICRKLAKEDTRIKIIDKERNEGQELARWSGIEASTGEYVMFMDQDDYYRHDAVQSLLDVLQYNDVDIVYGSMTRRIGFAYSKHYAIPSQATDKVIEGELKEELLVSWYGVNILPVQMWGHIFKRSLFFPRPVHTSLKLGEDQTMSLQIYLRARKVYALQTSYYVYNWGGITSKMQSTLLESAQGLYQFRLPYLEGKSAKEKYIHFMNIEMMHFVASYVDSLLVLDRKGANWKQRHLELMKKHEQNLFWECLQTLRSSKYNKNSDLSLIINRDFCGYYLAQFELQKRPKQIALRRARAVAAYVLRKLL